MTVVVHPGWYAVSFWSDDGNTLHTAKFDDFADAIALDQERNGDTATRPPVTADGKCAACGESDFLLAHDETVYEGLDWSDALQRLEVTHTSTERNDESTRLYCCQCGVYHTVPEELQ